MLITRASEYAILSLILLSKADSPQDSETLSIKLAISKSFLAKVLQTLAKNGILKSYKGVNGGFVLAEKPEDISMLKVMSAVEGKAPAVFDCSSSVNHCPSSRAHICSNYYSTSSTCNARYTFNNFNSIRCSDFTDFFICSKTNRPNNFSNTNSNSNPF